MIGSLRGKIIAKKPPIILLEVNGIGYEVAVSMNTLYQLPDNQEVVLLTHLVVREDTQELYGFIDQAEKTLFRHLIRTNGVGPKLALSILSSMSTQDFSHLVLSQDSAGLIKIPGIGKKMADRLIIEMADRLQDVADSSGGQVMDSHMPDPHRDAISALVSLGYKNHQAKKVIHSMRDSGYSSEEMIREALKQLAG